MAEGKSKPALTRTLSRMSSASTIGTDKAIAVFTSGGDSQGLFCIASHHCVKSKMSKCFCEMHICNPNVISASIRNECSCQSCCENGNHLWC